MGNDDDIPVAIPVPVAPYAAASQPTAPTAPITPIAPPAPTAPSTSMPYQHPGMQHQQSSFFVATTHQSTNNFNQYQLNQLRDQGYTTGLSRELLLFTKTFPLRFWVVDNSGSMSNTDGNRLVSTKNQSKIKMVPCTRWKEIQGTVDYHAQMSALLQAPTTFRLLNNPGAHVGKQEFSIGTNGPELIPQELQIAKDIMDRSSPTGVTPLAKHINEIRDQIHDLAPTLFEQGRKVAIILATDGLPTNQYGIAGRESNAEFTAALQRLEGLPVWIVIRLCTDEDKVVEFYNNIDSQLELSIEVLDDYMGEAKEVYAHNPWLNYTLPIHRMREMGIQNRLFDLLDERPFTRSELYDFCTLLFGIRAFDNVPDPEADFPDFIKKLEKINDRERGHWNPISKKAKSLIDVKEVGRVYGDGSCTIM